MEQTNQLIETLIKRIQFLETVISINKHILIMPKDEYQGIDLDTLPLSDMDLSDLIHSDSDESDYVSSEASIDFGEEYASDDDAQPMNNHSDLEMEPKITLSIDEIKAVREELNAHKQLAQPKEAIA